MPNWTKNELTVEGKTKEVRRFLKHMGEGFSCENVGIAVGVPGLLITGGPSGTPVMLRRKYGAKQ